MPASGGGFSGEVLLADWIWKSAPSALLATEEASGTCFFREPVMFSSFVGEAVGSTGARDCGGGSSPDAAAAGG